VGRQRATLAPVGAGAEDEIGSVIEEDQDRRDGRRVIGRAAIDYDTPIDEGLRERGDNQADRRRLFPGWDNRRHARACPCHRRLVILCQFAYRPARAAHRSPPCSRRCQ